MSIDNNIPATGLKGLEENWCIDLVVAVSAALVALPLAMGIALASGVSALAGLSAIIFIIRFVSCETKNAKTKKGDV